MSYMSLIKQPYAVGEHRASPDVLGTPYGTADCEELRPLEQRLRGQTALLAETFLNQLARTQYAHALHEALTAQERSQLYACAGAYLVELASPVLTKARHRELATRLGVVHAATGLTRSDLDQCYWQVISVVQDQAGSDISASALALYRERVARDLMYQREAYEVIEAKHRNVRGALAEAAWSADSYVTLADAICALLPGLTEVAACAVARTDGSGKLYFEAIGGALPEDGFLGLEEAMRTDLVSRPYWRAWHSGESSAIVHAPNTAGNPLPHAQLSHSMGIRSGAAIPLGRPGRAPEAVIILYSTYPGGLASPEQRAFFESLKSLLDLALLRLGTLESGAGPVPHAQRKHVTALLHGDGLEMHYQPIVELESGNVIKVEALARLRDGDRLLMPGVFLPSLSAEHMLELYERGLNQALHQHTEWRAQGVKLGLSVNLPPEALADERYYEATRAALAAHPCPPGTLTLEVLESGEVSMARPDAMERFSALGVQLAEDDLGSGYSGLARLRQLPFDWIKLDRSLVRLADGDNTDVLRFIFQLTRLGHGLNKRVVVEGVETADLWEAVRLLGVDAAQGFGIARPMPGSEVVAWLQNRITLGDSVSPQTSLGRQAWLMMLEERTHLTSQGVAGGANEQSRRLSRQLEELRADLDVIATSGDCEHAKTALLYAAASHGIDSVEYRQARGQVVAMM